MINTLYLPELREMLAEGNTAEPVALEQLIGRAPQAFTVESLSYLLR